MSAVMDRMRNESGGEPRRSRWIPWAFVAFFVALVVIQGVMAWIAVESFGGLTAEDAYQRGITYNRTLAAKDAETALGWQVAVGWTADKSAPGKGRLELRVMDGLGQPLQGAQVAARLRRPVGPENTLQATLVAGDPGVYSADLTLPLKGQWDVDLDIATAHSTDHLTDRIFAP
ncbi:MAG TPA: FixH family protein [Hypericibacter adhaerens]|jgi:nitrogen fixation protein FixH|uniref:Nitrogen fixation protein FixH n=1 Tax=Hypericibacter adhaerens TaxID=2602016 RepID=A0A5J6MUD3_9PROT|nr:FixH family protein [Hypericibacter adhaerens]QEX20764.1 hypothetical protein FRZ61_06830 [Hypericibacter adhaerens]HWA42196.1 FixH family protein [Hypericibacter adhaerens]